MDWFAKIGAALSGWVALATALCVVVGSYLYTRFATRKQVDEAMCKAGAADGALAQRLEDTERDLERRMVGLERAIDRLNIGLKNTPTRAEHEALRGDMSVLSARIEAMTSALTRIERPLQALVEHHMHRRGQ